MSISDAVNAGNAHMRFTVVVFVISLVAFLALILMLPYWPHGAFLSIDAGLWYGMLVIGLLSVAIAAGMFILSYVTGLPIDTA